MASKKQTTIKDLFNDTEKFGSAWGVKTKPKNPFSFEDKNNSKKYEQIINTPERSKQFKNDYISNLEKTIEEFKETKDTKVRQTNHLASQAIIYIAEELDIDVAEQKYDLQKNEYLIEKPTQMNFKNKKCVEDILRAVKLTTNKHYSGIRMDSGEVIQLKASYDSNTAKVKDKLISTIFPTNNESNKFQDQKYAA